MGRIIFITGTDTGVGKTAVMGLLLAHAARSHAAVCGLKPFCSGDRNDASLCWELQGGRGSIDQVNPWFFPKPIAPWSAARLDGKTVRLDETLEWLHRACADAELALVEGAGGLLTPLGEDFDSADLIVGLRAEVIVVAANRLGVINHARLTVEALQARAVPRITVALADHPGADISRESNFSDLTDLLAPVRVLRLPFLENYCPHPAFITSAASRLPQLLDELIV